MTEWLVGFRDGGVVDHIVVTASWAIAAAHAARSERPRALIVAVIGHPDPADPFALIQYSDLPQRYIELRRYSAPRTSPHGYLVVMIGPDGSRRSVPNRPISLEQARQHRDWMLRGYFEAVHRNLRSPMLAASPHLPVVVSLDPVDE